MKIKKTILVLCFLLMIVASGFCQPVKEIFNRETPIIWLGMDFSQAKFIGDREKYGSSSDVKFLLKSFNDLIDREKDKFSVARATRKITAEHHADIARAHNEELDISEILSNKEEESLHLKEEDIATIISSYDFAGLKGIGLMFNVESFDKFKQQAAIWVTFIDLNTKEILITERILSRPVGSGVRNYWAGAVRETMEKLERKNMEVWRKKFAPEKR
jgi:hypothetical protein